MYIYQECSNLTEVRRADDHNIYATTKTMCPPSYHHNEFVATHGLVPKLKQNLFKTMKSIQNCAKIFLLNLKAYRYLNPYTSFREKRFKSNFRGYLSIPICMGLNLAFSANQPSSKMLQNISSRIRILFQLDLMFYFIKKRTQAFLWYRFRCSGLSPN